MKPGASSERAVILATSERDAVEIGSLIKRAGYQFNICGELTALRQEIAGGAGLAVIACEALRQLNISVLTRWLNDQPSWSDFPIVLLTQRGDGPERNPETSRLGRELGNVTFIERPFRPATLASVVGAAVRARRRQYQTRAILAQLAAERTALAELTATLEQRVEQRTGDLMKEVAAREKAQEQLRHAQKLEAIGQLTGGVAHDFNNLLMAVMGNLDLLRKRLPSDPQLLRLVDRALLGAERGASLTQRLLAFARRQDLRVISVDLRALVLDMVNLLERSLGPRVKLRLDIPDGLPPARADANQLELAILNLAINARDAMPEGGTIEIKIAGGESDGEDSLKPGRYLMLSLTDSGSGMSPDVLKRAIEPFFSLKPPGKGSGLGLSMVHGLAVQLGGALQLASVTGEGTTATLMLPAAAAAPERDSRTQHVQRTPRCAVILIVDDDPLIASSTTEMLEDLGHKVIGVNSARHALDILESEQPIDLMVTDHMMPDMTGLELAAASREVRPSLPVLLATGYADLPDGAQVDLPRLAKPYHQDQLRDQLERLLG